MSHPIIKTREFLDKWYDGHRGLTKYPRKAFVDTIKLEYVEFQNIWANVQIVKASMNSTMKTSSIELKLKSQSLNSLILSSGKKILKRKALRIRKRRPYLRRIRFKSSSNSFQKLLHIRWWLLITLIRNINHLFCYNQMIYPTIIT